MPFPPNRLGPDPRISSRRAGRLYRLVTALSKKPLARTQLIRLGRVGMRTFYRDLTFLAGYEIVVQMSGGRYKLATPMKEALHRLPFPPPELTFGDVMDLSKGRTAAHAKLRTQLEDLTH